MALSLPPVPIGEPPDSFAWQQWYLALQELLGNTGAVSWDLVDKSGSSLSDLASRDHSDLQNVQGGTTGERYHLTLAQATAISGLASGTYTPTLVNVTNLDASTPYVCQYLRVGTIVHVSGLVDVDPTAAGLAELAVSLPVSSNLANVYELAGVGSFKDESALIFGDAANNRAIVQWTAVDLTNRTMSFTFTYRVI